MSNLDQIVSLVKAAYSQIEQLEDSLHWQQELCVLQDKLVKQVHTVAVFGAFSAGKSSLLNAILGKQTLAVSPNPTTATVTHIYADSELEVGKATIHMKSFEQMWMDIQQAFAKLHLRPTSMAEAAEQARLLKIAQYPPHARISVSFLVAMAKGYEQMSWRLGSVFSVSAAQVGIYTAEEQFACFVQQVDIGQTAEFLDNGMILVDTPGVDSIHKRHTDVAFEYMRKADAIVFVLYYSHAFSRADKEFLLQLAGVQDVAGADKLFVVINAVDLATSIEERAAVRERVRQELQSVGIRMPRIHEVSSQLAFAAHDLQSESAHSPFERLVRLRLHLSDTAPLPNLQTLMENSGLPKFVSELSQFIQNQGETLLQDSALRTLQDIEKQVSDICSRKELFIHQDEHKILQIQSIYRKLESEWLATGEQFAQGLSAEENGLKIDWQELLFHASERIRFQFQSLFREAFHPGQFRSGTNQKQQLNEAALDFVANLERLIEIEIRTYSLRLDQSVQHLCRHVRERIAIDSSEAGVPPVHYLLHPYERLHDDALIRAHIPTEQITPGFRFFTSAKQFFEGDGASQMVNLIEAGVLAQVKSELNRIGQLVATAVLSSMRSEVQAAWTMAAEATHVIDKDSECTDVEASFAKWKQVQAWFVNQDWTFSSDTV